MKTIKDIPEHSRPREKLREKGASALTDEVMGDAHKIINSKRGQSMICADRLMELQEKTLMF